MIESNDPSEFSPPVSVLDRAQAVSKALADAARRARFSVRARGAHRGGSFQARSGAKLMRVLTLSLFVGLVAVPDLVVTVYYGLIASDQYVSEAKFTVSSGAIPKMDGLGAITGVPSMLIVQDTQVVTSYIGSRAMVERLERAVGLREAYSATSIDWWSRFRKAKPIEKFTAYWEKMSDTSISFPSGIVTLTVRAFAPDDAKRIADAVIAQSESLLNDLNERMRNDTVLASERDMQQAAADLGKARIAMEAERNAEGLIDVGQASNALNGLIAGLQSDLLVAQQQYNAELHYVTADAPQMKVLNSRIGAMQSQLQQMKAQLTAQTELGVAAVADKALSGKMTKFAELDLEERIAEKRYEVAAASVEAARMMSERRMLYLHEVVEPALPEDAKYPRRLLNIGMTILASLLAWAATVGALHFVRNHMA